MFGGINYNNDKKDTQLNTVEMLKSGEDWFIEGTLCEAAFSFGYALVF